MNGQRKDKHASAVRRALSRSRRFSSAAARVASRSFCLSACTTRTVLESTLLQQVGHKWLADVR